MVKSVSMGVAVESDDEGADIDQIIEKAKATSTVSNSIGNGFPIDVIGRSLT